MMKEFGRCLVLASLVYAQIGSVSAAEPPIATPIQAVARLRKPDVVEAVKAVEAACRGRYRRSLVDAPQLLAEAKRMLASSKVARHRGALDLRRCFSEAKFLSTLLLPELKKSDTARLIYAVEVSARLESAAVVPALLELLAPRTEGCLQKELDASEKELCVWLAYAPGAGLKDADDALRLRTGEAVVGLLESPHAKVREVTVETLAAARLKRFATPIRNLIQRENDRMYPEANSSSMLQRFRKRARTLESGG